MTEADWLTSEDPTAMLAWLGSAAPVRKLLLFGVASCYLSHQSPPVRIPIFDVVERYADGHATTAEVREHWPRDREPECVSWPERAFRWVTTFARSSQAWGVESGDYPSALLLPPLLRDIFGNPFRPAVFDSRWRTADTLGLARGIYAHRAFDRLPLLADALMDAGCDDDQIISHCRTGGPHVRGCWVVDLVLGKQ